MNFLIILGYLVIALNLFAIVLSAFYIFQKIINKN